MILVHEGLFDLHVDSSVLRALKHRRFGSNMDRRMSKQYVVQNSSAVAVSERSGGRWTDEFIEFVCLSSTMNVSTTSLEDFILWYMMIVR